MNVRRIVCLAAALLAAGWLTTSFTSGQEMTLSSQVTERVLPNGLKVLMVRRPTPRWSAASSRTASDR